LGAAKACEMAPTTQSATMSATGDADEDKEQGTRNKDERTTGRREKGEREEERRMRFALGGRGEAVGHTMHR